jgi:hypothetical protein
MQDEVANDDAQLPKSNPSCRHGDASTVSTTHSAALLLTVLHAAGTLFEIGSWLLYWEALNPEPHVVTGRELQQPPTKQRSDRFHSSNHTHDDRAKQQRADMRTHSNGVYVPADVPEDQQTARDAHQLHPAGVSSIHNEAAASAVHSSSNVASTVPGTLHYTVNERPRIAAYRQVQQQQQPRRRWKPSAADSAQQQQHDDVEAPVDNASDAAAQQHTSAAAATAAAGSTADAAAAGEVVNGGQPQSWRWWGLRLHDIGFMARLLQLIGATIFWVSRLHS